MKENDVTTVRLTERAQYIKDEWCHLGLKNILSAGLVLFARLNAQQKLDTIKEANSIDPKTVLEHQDAQLKAASKRANKKRPAG